MRISDWSSYVCSSDLPVHGVHLSFCRAEDGNPPPALLALGNQLLDRFDDIADGRELGCRIEIGRASCRERVCQYVSISVVDVAIKKNTNNRQHIGTYI